MKRTIQLIIISIGFFWACTLHAQKNSSSVNYRHQIFTGAGKFFWFEGWNIYLGYEYKVNDLIGIIGGVDIGINEVFDPSFYQLRYSDVAGKAAFSIITERIHYPEVAGELAYDFNEFGFPLEANGGSLNTRYLPFVGISFNFRPKKRIHWGLRTSFAVEHRSGADIVAFLPTDFLNFNGGNDLFVDYAFTEYFGAWWDYFFNNEAYVGYRMNDKTSLTFRYVLYSYANISTLKTDRTWGTGTMSVALGIQTNF